jgi:hypothetical protein
MKKRILGIILGVSLIPVMVLAKSNINDRISEIVYQRQQNFIKQSYEIENTEISRYGKYFKELFLGEENTENLMSQGDLYKSMDSTQKDKLDQYLDIIEDREIATRQDKLDRFNENRTEEDFDNPTQEDLDAIHKIQTEPIRNIMQKVYYDVDKCEAYDTWFIKIKDSDTFIVTFRWYQDRVEEITMKSVDRK